MSLLDTARNKSGDPALVESQVKRKTREIVRAYRHSWDIYSELLQNSVDAINRRYRILNDPDFRLYTDYRQKYLTLESDQNYAGQIGIVVNVPAREIEIRDNGIGIWADKMEEFLLPEGGDKQIGQEYGFKGFGLSYAAFISDEFYIASKPAFESEACEVSLNGLFAWLIDDNGLVKFPETPTPDVSPASGEWNENWNTIVRVKLADDYTTRFPAVSSADQAIRLASEKARLDGFDFILRTRTALGNTRVLFNKAPIVQIDIKLKVIFPDGEAPEKEIPYRYYHPKDHEEVAVISYDFRDYFQQYKTPSFNKNFRALFHAVPNQQIGARRPLNCDFALAAISSTRLRNIEEILRLDEIESGDVGVNHGVHLAINGMPTGLRIDDWDTRGAYLKRYYIIVDADLEISNQLDPGRKGISQYFARQISEKAIELIGNSTVDDSNPFGSYASKHLDYGQVPEPGGLPPQDFQIKVNQVRQQAEQQPEIQDILSQLNALSHLIYPPTDEQEVVALFYELQQQGIIKGYRTVYLAGSSAVYDAAFEYEIECSEENIFEQDLLGIGKVLVQDLKSRGEPSYVHRNHYSTRTALPELCVEFKKSIGGFLEEIYRKSGRSAKDPNLINLLIAWDIDIPPSIPKDMYTIDPLFGNRRVFHGTTHRLGLIGSQNTEIQCIVLKDVLIKLSGIK